LNNFTSKEIQLLFQQHSKTTGQLFDEEIITELWQDTQGQPWLINALGYEMTWENKDARDRDQPITLEQYYIARDNLIQSRATHLDQLVDKLNEPRVHEVIASLLSGEQSDLKTSHDDLQYIEDLGLIIQKPQIRISNRIYREIIPRELTAVTQANITQEQSWYLTSENHLDMNKLLTAFQQFYRENSESWIERFDYKEAGSQLLMQAFLQRIINGGGRIFREYALGRKRTDLCIEWPVDHKKGFYGDVQKIIIELKIQRGKLETIIDKSLEQTAEYADKFNTEEAYLIIFNNDKTTSWDDKIWQMNKQHKNYLIGVWGM
ncbi:MAG: ATP-binding protein, partial [Methylococcales bacterium]|nr:ATP-binding protein [Methylococcales bacterium]